MTGQRAHPDAEAIADCQAGVTGFWRAFRRPLQRRVAAHIAGCTRCSALARQLSEVSVVLAAAPRPSMPVSVAERLTAALAAEAGATEVNGGIREPGAVLAAPDGGQDRAGGHGGGRGRGGRRRVLVPVSVTLSILAAIGGGGYVLSHQGSSASIASSSNAAGKSAAGSRAGSHHLGTAESPASSYSGITGYPVVASGTDYQAAGLGAQISREVNAGAALSTTVAPGNLAGCVRRVSGGAHVVFVDLARYQGQQAFVIASAGRAWVAGTGCSTARSDLLAAVAIAARS
jgi:hypothetical protein